MSRINDEGFYTALQVLDAAQDTDLTPSEERLLQRAEETLKDVQHRQRD